AIRYSARSSFNMRNSSLKSGRSAMLELLSHDDHFPCCVEDRLITLLLPKFNVELAVRKSVSNDPCFPLLLLSIHDMPTRCRWGFPLGPANLSFLYITFAG